MNSQFSNTISRGEPGRRWRRSRPASVPVIEGNISSSCSLGVRKGRWPLPDLGCLSDGCRWCTAQSEDRRPLAGM